MSDPEPVAKAVQSGVAAVRALEDAARDVEGLLDARSAAAMRSMAVKVGGVVHELEQLKGSSDE
jgi:hypothetical protein